jgi:hypothetical protein
LAGVPRDYFDTEFRDDMADRLADVPEQELVTPRSSVAGPTILGLGFSLDEPQLKAMYLNLLATASDKRVQDSAHPSFAEVIKQLSAAEAEALAAVLQIGVLPIVEIRLNAEPSTETEDDPIRKMTKQLTPSPEGYTILATHVQTGA